MSGGSHEHRIETPLGAVVVTTAGCANHLERLSVSVPELPPGLRVDGVALLRVRPLQAITPHKTLLLKIACGRPGSAETGEWLESMAFEGPEGVLQVGLRDRDWLSERGVMASHVGYEADGLWQEVTEAKAEASLFVSVAWRLSDRADADQDVSTWYAVDLVLPDGLKGA